VVGGRGKGQCPHRSANAVQYQVATWRVAGQTDGDRHDRAQAVDKTKAQYPDIRMAANVLQRTVAQHLPAGFACQQFAPVLAPHEVPQLVTGVAAQKGHHDHQVDIHVSAERKEARENQDGLAFEKRAKKKGKIAEIL